MKAFFLTTALVMFIGSFAQAGLEAIDNCYSSHPNDNRAAAYCADQVIARAVISISDKVEKQAAGVTKVCACEEATSFVGFELVQRVTNQTSGKTERIVLRKLEVNWPILCEKALQADSRCQ